MILTIHVKPNAKVTKVVSKLDDQTFVIALHAPATEGKANEELVEFLSDKLNIPKTFINLKRGHNSRVKHLEVPEGTNIFL
ncbi:MAG: uncharacterized protein QG626_239 [Patescibacteria group bacterium]|jgi:uncharacterized protein (TIGR00251 family)|nr:uncharacterized protein [Patescibacteria group bacterium]